LSILGGIKLKTTVNIITPAYNSALTIWRTYTSISEQTHKDWRWIVIDDCSEDSTVHTIEQICALDHRVCLLKSPRRLGAGACRNIGLKHVTSKIITFIDSDDEWFPEFLEKMLTFVLAPNTMAFCGYVRRSNGTDCFFVPKINYSRDMLFRGSDISCLSAIYHFDCISEIPSFGVVRARSDLIFNIGALSIISQAIAVKDVLAIYNFHPGSISYNKFRLAYWQYYTSRLFGRSMITSMLDVFFWGLYGVKKYWIIR
jgi:teichuronic acid biosynthesis glycosyltransferase TuaG